MNSGFIKQHTAPIKKNRKPYIDAEVLDAIENIKATLLIEKKKGNPNADFILRRMR
jgi:hypothetical protein